MYFPISNLKISAFPFVKTAKVYFLERIRKALVTPSNNLISCLWFIKKSKASSANLIASEGDTRCLIFNLKISFLNLLISHAILGSFSIKALLRLIKSSKLPHSTSPTFSSTHFLVSISAFAIVGPLSQKVSSRSNVMSLIFFMFSPRMCLIINFY